MTSCGWLASPRPSLLCSPTASSQVLSCNSARCCRACRCSRQNHRWMTYSTRGFRSWDLWGLRPDGPSDCCGRLSPAVARGSSRSTVSSVPCCQPPLPRLLRPEMPSSYGSVRSSHSRADLLCATRRRT